MVLDFSALLCRRGALLYYLEEDVCLHLRDTMASTVYIHQKTLHIPCSKCSKKHMKQSVMGMLCTYKKFEDFYVT